jgi:hypothetical protein
MKHFFSYHRWLILALLGAGITHGQDPQNGQDTIFLKQGEAIAGRIAGFDGRTIKLQRFLQPLPGGPLDREPVSASLTVPISRVERVEFFFDEARDRKLRSATTASISEVEALWREAFPWLSIPKSPAGEVGLSYGNLLLDAGDFAGAQKALQIFESIETGSWSQEARTRARQGRLRAMIATGQAQQAISEAEEIVRAAEDPAILIEAKFVLAQAAHRALEKFVADNPRWQEDLFAIPERNRLYDEALALYLYPALFFGSEINAGARGLWGAVQIYQFAGDLKQALEASRDLVSIYPETVHARQAQALIDTLPDSLKKQNNETYIRP